MKEIEQVLKRQVLAKAKLIQLTMELMGLLLDLEQLLAFGRQLLLC
jgi:hypothetical protein